MRINYPLTIKESHIIIESLDNMEIVSAHSNLVKQVVRGTIFIVTTLEDLDTKPFEIELHELLVCKKALNKTKKSSDKAKDDIIIKIDESLKKYDVSDLNTQIDKVFS